MYKFLLLCLWLPCFAFAQNTITYYSNTLKDKNGKPLAGATVVNNTTRQGTSADNNGYFKIQANPGDVLTVYAVGYNTSQIMVSSKLLQAASNNSQQIVAPVLSTDYTALIKNTSQVNSNNQPDSTYNISLSKLRIGPHSSPYFNISNLKIKNNQLLIRPYYNKRLSFGGNYSSSIEIKQINKLPELQNEYAQGRPLNGKLTWQGPETGEVFSFGPAISSLSYDGSNYLYDINGKLLANSNGKPANTYDNSIFRTAILQSQSLHFHSSLFHQNTYQPLLYLSVNVGQVGQNSTIQQNRNTANKIGTLLVANTKRFNITGTYNYQHDKFSNSNRNGFLNRVYQNAILTPASFSNQQGYLLSTAQRSYSNNADNPYFLLTDNGNGYNRTQSNGGVTIEHARAKFSYRISQSYEAVKQQSIEGYKPYTIAFETGITNQRIQSDKTYSSQANTTYTIEKNQLSHIASANYIFTATQTNISYTNPNHFYQYQRSAHDVALNWATMYHGYWFETGGSIANKFYFSNTAKHGSLLLPSVSGYFQFRNVLELVNIKFVSNWYSFASELPIQQSLSYTNLLQYNTQQSSQYFPATEVTSYKDLAPVKHNEWTGRVEVDYNYKASLTAEVFVRNTKGDIFPVYEGGKLNLKNVASHQTRGIELQLDVNPNLYNYRKLKWGHTLSFIAYNNKVMHVENGYDYLPIAGFKNVHKSLIEGQSLGAIVGNAWLKDKNGNNVIGADGFPLVSPQPQIIGNPIPDFVLKVSNSASWKSWKLGADLEWKKGGDVWNGTQAVLDHYGRSGSSAQLRNTTNYIFAGVMQNGDKNSKPVSFLDPAKPVNENRWTRYGYSGVAEAYIQKGDYLRIHSISLSYKHSFHKIVQSLTVSAYAGNILLWSAYKGTDPSQLLYDNPGSEGLDFFNLPSVKSFGVSASIQF